MLLRSRQMARLDRLDDKVQSASAATANLFSCVIAAACELLPGNNYAGNTARLHSLIELGAWTDAALAVVELELPHWKVRRLVLEDGRWFCSLSKQAYLPLGLDESADATHEVLPLAILGAFLEARRQAVARPGSLPIAGHVSAPAGAATYRDSSLCAIPCDNFR